MQRLLVGLGGLVFLALPWFLGSPVKRFAEWRESSGWPRVEATVVAVKAVNFADDGRRQRWGDDPEYDLTLEFPFEGRQARAMLRHEHTLAVSFVGTGAPKKGDKLHVLVNPRKPEEVYRGRSEILVLAALLLASLLVGPYLIWRAISGPVDDLAD